MRFFWESVPFSVALVKGKMSESLGKKLDEGSKEECCSGNQKNVVKISEEDKVIGNDSKIGRENSVTLQDQEKYIAKNEDNFAVMINGSF